MLTHFWPVTLPSENWGYVICLVYLLNYLAAKAAGHKQFSIGVSPCVYVHVCYNVWVLMGSRAVCLCNYINSMWQFRFMFSFISNLPLAPSRHPHTNSSSRCVKAIRIQHLLPFIGTASGTNSQKWEFCISIYVLQAGVAHPMQIMFISNIQFHAHRPTKLVVDFPFSLCHFSLVFSVYRCL